MMTRDQMKRRLIPGKVVPKCHVLLFVKAEARDTNVNQLVHPKAQCEAGEGVEQRILKQLQCLGLEPPTLVRKGEISLALP